MELKPGYKQTEVGVIPEDWEIKEINQICKPSNVRINPLTTITNYRCIELEHLSQGAGQLLGFADSNHLKSQKTVFKIGDVLFGKLRPYLKKYYFSEFEGVCTTEIWVLNADSDVVNRWLYFIVQSDRFLDIANQSTGTKMPRAEWSVVGKALIPFPPNKIEQTAIANALSDADALIQSLTRLIAKKRQIKQGAMQTLLNPYENGRLKAGWVVKSLGRVAEFINGRAYSLSEWENYGTPVIRLQNLTGRGDEFYYSNLKLPEKQYCIAGDLLFMWSATFGPVIWQGEKAIYHYHIWKIECKPKEIDKMYLYFILDELTERLKRSSSNGGTMLHVTKEKMESIEIHFPPVEEQTRIATMLSDMDAEIAALETKLIKYQQIKQGMMQNLLTGRIRLVKPESNTGAAA